MDHPGADPRYTASYYGRAPAPPERLHPRIPGGIAHSPTPPRYASAPGQHSPLEHSARYDSAGNSPSHPSGSPSNDELVTKYQARAETLKSKLFAAEQDAADFHTQRTEVVEALEVMTQRAKSKEKLLEFKAAQCEELNKQVAAQKALIEELTSEAAEARETMKTLRADNMTVTALATRVQALEEELLRSETTISSLTREKQTQAKQASDKAHIIRVQQQSLEQVKEALVKRAKEVEQEDERAATAEEEVIRLKAEAARLIAEHAEVRHQKATAIDMLNDSVQELMATVKAKSLRVNDLTVQVETWRSKFDVCDRELGEEKARRLKEVRDLELKNSDLTAKSNKLDKDVRFLESAVDDLRQHNAHLTSDAAQYKLTLMNQGRVTEADHRARHTYTLTELTARLHAAEGRTLEAEAQRDALTAQLGSASQRRHAMPAAAPTTDVTEGESAVSPGHSFDEDEEDGRVSAPTIADDYVSQRLAAKVASGKKPFSAVDAATLLLTGGAPAQRSCATQTERRGSSSHSPVRAMARAGKRPGTSPASSPLATTTSSEVLASDPAWDTPPPRRGSAMHGSPSVGSPAADAVRTAPISVESPDGIVFSSHGVDRQDEHASRATPPRSTGSQRSRSQGTRGRRVSPPDSAGTHSASVSPVKSGKRLSSGRATTSSSSPGRVPWRT